MSIIRQRQLTDTVTRWRQGEQSQLPPYTTQWGNPVTFSCRYSTKNKTVRSDDGSEFIPATIFYLSGVVDIRKGDRVLLGDHSTISEPPGDSEDVRQIYTSTPLRGPQDTTVFTG